MPAAWPGSHRSATDGAETLEHAPPAMRRPDRSDPARSRAPGCRAARGRVRRRSRSRRAAGRPAGSEGPGTPASVRLVGEAARRSSPPPAAARGAAPRRSRTASRPSPPSGSRRRRASASRRRPAGRSRDGRRAGRAAAPPAAAATSSAPIAEPPIASTMTASTSRSRASGSNDGGDLAGLRQLPRHLGDLAEHVLGVDPTQRGRIVEGDRLLEQRRPFVVPLLGGIGAAGLLVGVLVAEEVAGVHQPATVARGCSAAAIRRPSASSASTSSGERAST